MMLDTTKLYGLIPVGMTLIFTQGHKAMGKLKLYSCCVVKLHETTQMFMIVGYVREMTVKTSYKYGEYGLFEHLLFVLSLISIK